MQEKITFIIFYIKKANVNTVFIPNSLYLCINQKKLKKPLTKVCQPCKMLKVNFRQGKNLKRNESLLLLN